MSGGNVIHVTNDNKWVLCLSSIHLTRPVASNYRRRLLAGIDNKRHVLLSYMTCYFHSYTGSVTCIWWRTTACVSRSENRRQPSYGVSSRSCGMIGYRCFPVQSFRDLFLATMSPWISATWGKVQLNVRVILWEVDGGVSSEDKDREGGGEQEPVD